MSLHIVREAYYNYDVQVIKVTDNCIWYKTQLVKWIPNTDYCYVNTKILTNIQTNQTSIQSLF